MLRKFDPGKPIWGFIFGAGGLLVALITLVVAIVQLGQNPSPSEAELTATVPIAVNETIQAYAAQTMTPDMLNTYATQTGLAREPSAAPTRRVVTLIPMPTIAADTLTPLPTITPSMTRTSAPPTITPTATFTMTDTPLPPTDATMPPTVPPTTPPSRTGGNGVDITLFRQSDLLAMYVPEAVSLDGLAFHVAHTDGSADDVYPLSQYPSLAGIPWSTPQMVIPGCFVLRLRPVASPLPMECQQVPSGNVFLQDLSAADIFWYDSVRNADVPFQVWRGDLLLGLCAAGQAACTIALPL
ncbi:MAG: hypothetical protein U0670_03275 [Anaerolineae bacterium]